MFLFHFKCIFTLALVRNQSSSILINCILFNLNCLTYFQVEQITAEYKVLALQYHPDKNDGDKDAEVKFQKLKVN